MAERPQRAKVIAETRQLPPEVDEWAATTTAGMLAGMMYGGLREAANGRMPNQDAVLPTLKNVPNEFPQTSRSLMEERLLRISRASVLGGVRLGTLAGLFTGVQLALAVHRDQRDTLNVVAAGATTAAAVGLSMPGSGMARLQGGVRGAIVGALLAFPLGLLQTTLQNMLPPSSSKDSKTSERTDGVEEAIKRMEQQFEQRFEKAAESSQDTEAI